MILAQFVHARSCRECGFSLVELTIAIALGVTLSFVVCHLLLQSKRSYVASQALARMEDNGRYAMRYLSHELRMAGHLADIDPRTRVRAMVLGSACFNFLMRTEVPFVHSNDVTEDGQPKIDVEALPGDCLLPGKHKAESDILAVRRSASQPSLLYGSHYASVDSNDLFVSRQSEYHLPVLQRGRDVNRNGASWLYQPQVLFVRNFSTLQGDNIPSLCRKRPGRSTNRMAPTECLIEGIEMLQIEYGLDDTGNLQIDRYVAAPTADDLEQAVAARLYILVRSLREIAGHTDSRSYRLGSKVIPAARDGYLRRLMQTTVLLRNNAVMHL
ncbi:MAG: PilW family protein [Pseudomonadota bacterium]